MAGMHKSAPEWHALRDGLSDAVCGTSAGMLRIAAVDAILSADRRMSIPAWLLAPFQVCCMMCDLGALMGQTSPGMCCWASLSLPSQQLSRLSAHLPPVTELAARLVMSALHSAVT